MRRQCTGPSGIDFQFQWRKTGESILGLKNKNKNNDLDFFGFKDMNFFGYKIYQMNKIGICFIKLYSRGSSLPSGNLSLTTLIGHRPPTTS